MPGVKMVVLAVLLLFFAGCGGTSTYPYRVVNDDCSCELFRITDGKVNVVYSFSAVYSLDKAMKTQITISLQNDNADTLDLSLAYVRVSSRNIPYHRNGKFIPVGVPDIPPGAQRVLTLKGEVEEDGKGNPWRAIAGEELVVTLKGMRLNGKPIAMQVVRFVPHNPKLSS